MSHDFIPVPPVRLNLANRATDNPSANDLQQPQLSTSHFIDIRQPHSFAPPWYSILALMGALSCPPFRVSRIFFPWTGWTTYGGLHLRKRSAHAIRAAGPGFIQTMHLQTSYVDTPSAPKKTRDKSRKTRAMEYAVHGRRKPLQGSRCAPVPQIYFVRIQIQDL